MKSTQSAATLKDIAEKVGVSVTTVSRILNGRATGIPIRPETREKVLSAALELKYKPNLLARSLRGSNTLLLGVIARDITDPFHIQILQGINGTATKHGYRVFLGHVNYQPDAAVAYGSMFEQSHADGIIMIGDLEGDEAALNVLLKQHRIIVGVTDRIARREFPGVYADGALGTRLAMEHLWNLGHRNIICVAYPSIIDGKVRLDIYQQFMRERGLQDKIRFYITPLDPESSFKLGQEIFANFNASAGPTAIYAASDTIAIGLLQAAYQAGIVVPDQVSIVGYDNIEITSFTIPPLTTIDQFGVVMGQRVAEMALDMIEHDRDRSDVDDVILNPQLVVRQSTTSPSNKA
jgi:DNA-binding LacI/PurR family transcriptional regulator